VHNLKLKLKNGDLAVGTMISEIRNPNLAYLLAQCGFDFFVIDNEHGSYSPETISNMIAAARGADVLTIVRIPEIRRETILKPLDCGAAGLLVPQVNTAHQVKEIMTHAKYPPLGNRGVALSRPHSLYARPNADQYLEQANEDTFIAVQAESPEAIQNLESIAAAPGVDAIFVGPADLSVSLGIPGQVTHPDEIQAIDRVVEVCQKHGISPGIHMSNLEMLSAWIKKGMRFVTFSSDVDMLARSAADSLVQLKKAIKNT
jgi:2-dehydro-3-deoxyglucarate aldolase/4-hydroxy-2-oxoheptanedioate aldolase